jgi:hypothetical protein
MEQQLSPHRVATAHPDGLTHDPEQEVERHCTTSRCNFARLGI